MRDTLRFFELAELTFRYTLREAIEDGRLVPYRIYRAMTVKTAAEDGFRVRRGELDWSAMDVKARAESKELFARQDTITVDPRALERTLTIPERNQLVQRRGARVTAEREANQPLFPRAVRRSPRGAGRSVGERKTWVGLLSRET